MGRTNIGIGELRVFRLFLSEQRRLYGHEISILNDMNHPDVYYALKKLVGRGWLESSWEKGTPKDRPRRKYYKITSAGRTKGRYAYEAALRQLQM